MRHVFGRLQCLNLSFQLITQHPKGQSLRLGTPWRAKKPGIVVWARPELE